MSMERVSVVDTIFVFLKPSPAFPLQSWRIIFNLVIWFLLKCGHVSYVVSEICIASM